MVVIALVLGFLIHAYKNGAILDPTTLAQGWDRLLVFLEQAYPPDLSRLGPITEALVVTIDIAVVGTLIGVVLSLPFALLSARNINSNRATYYLSRIIVSFFRTVPSLVWGIVFVVLVGLGPKAGVLAIVMETIGFCGRLFAESIEEIDEGTLEGVRATGASKFAVIMTAVLPSRAPAFVAISLFAFELMTRASVVLGIVGAGGIGVELTTSMQLLRFDEAATIILAIFAVVIVVERLSSALRARII